MRRLVVLAMLALVATQSPAVAAEDWVAQAQHRLNHLGCDAGRADGRLDRQTRSAVIRLQSRVGLRQSGHLDEPTRKQLAAGGAPRCDVRPVPSGSGTGRRIVISQGQNWVWLVGPRGGIVDQGPMVDNSSVLHRGADATGSYCGRTARIRLNQDASGSVWLDNFVRFAPCGIGFHRIPRAKSTGRQIHADWVLGTDMAQSHGCIRLSQELSRHVWSFTTRRTPVRVL